MVDRRKRGWSLTSSPGEMANDDRPLFPHNDEAERCVLGAILIDNAQFDVAASILDDSAFFHESHSRVWEAMVALADKRKPIDLVQIKDELARSNELANCGGPAYIASLTDGVPRAANVDHYARIVKEMATKRSLSHFARRIIDAVRSSDQAPDDILNNADQALLRLSGQVEDSEEVTMEQAANQHFDRLSWRVEHRGELIGIDTGFQQINEDTLGWQRRDLTIIAARPSMGKTAFAMNSVIASAKNGARWAVFSLEMDRSQLMDRLIAVESGIPLSRILAGYFGEAEYEKLSLALSSIAALPMVIDDGSTQTISGIRRKARRMITQLGGLDGILIDYVQLMSAERDHRHENRTQQLDDISRDAKKLAKELNVAMMVLSQLSRKPKGQEEEEPTMSDLRQSGGLEQNADVVAFIHRINHKMGGPTKFIIDKQRMGPTGARMLDFDRDITKFTDAPDAPMLVPPPKPARSSSKRGRPLLPSSAVEVPNMGF